MTPNLAVAEKLSQKSPHRWRAFVSQPVVFIAEFGGYGWNRTTDLGIMSLAL